MIPPVKKKKAHFELIIFCIGLFLLASIPLSGTNLKDGNKNLEEDFSLALKYVRASDTDSAKILLNHIILQLTEKEELNTYLGLSARLHLANILIPEREDFASQEFIDLIEVGTERQEWEVVAHAHILLGMIYETLGDKETCEYHLDQAIFLIDRHELESIYHRYAIGRSSYFRVFNLSIDSALFYAKEALNKIPAEPSESKAAAYFLIGQLLKDSSYTLQISYLSKSAGAFLELGDYFGHVAMINNISRKYWDNRQMDSAMVYSDSVIFLLEQLKPYRYDYFSIKSSAYKHRAKLYKFSGRMEKAWEYNEISQQADLEYINRLNARAITEVKEKYKDEKKTRQIEQQAQDIKFEKARRNEAIAFAIIIFLFTAILIYFYFRLFKANQKNKAQAEHLAKLDQIKSRFFANVSHELRTPLTLLLGPVRSLLKNNRLSPLEQEFIHLAHKNGQQLEKLINGILDLGKMEIGKLELKLEATELKTFFLPFLAQFESLAHHKSIHFGFEVTIDNETTAMIDREKYRQILYNLLSNAFKFTPRGGKILSRLSIEQNRLILVVKDNGPGIHPDDIPHLFNRYFQTNRPEKPAGGGTGIGLALCREYVQLMQGSIEVESVPGTGTLFTVIIPKITIEGSVTAKKAPDWETKFEKGDMAVEQTENHISIEPLTQSTQKNTKPHLLLVEDNLDLQKYIRMVLSDKYRITTAMNGEEALVLIAKGNPYHLIISDLMMPIMDGYQFLERIKSSDATRHIPFIMLTARASLQDKLKSLRIGVDDYLNKPFNEEELTARIDNMLRQQTIRQQAVTLDNHEEAQIMISAADQEWLTSFEAFVKTHLDCDIFSVQMMADEFHMSRSTLLRQLKRLTGFSPKQYLLEARLLKARQLLEKQSFRSVAHVAYAIGYTDVRPFSRAFKKRFGKLPSELQKETT